MFKLCISKSVTNGDKKNDEFPVELLSLLNDTKFQVNFTFCSIETKICLPFQIFTLDILLFSVFST